MHAYGPHVDPDYSPFEEFYDVMRRAGRKIGLRLRPLEHAGEIYGHRSAEVSLGSNLTASAQSIDVAACSLAIMAAASAPAQAERAAAAGFCHRRGLTWG